MKRVILIFISLLICLSLSACDGHENDIKQDLADTLNAIGDGTLDAHSYIYGSNLNIATGDTNIQGGEITEKIATLVEYEILGQHRINAKNRIIQWVPNKNCE